VSFYNIATPFPGTPMYDQIIENGWLKITDFDKYDTATPTFETPWISMRKLWEIRQQAFHHFYLRPAYFLDRRRAFRFSTALIVLTHLYGTVKLKLRLAHI
jgi:hypothetical protein